jgi:hypothetical protein
VTNEPHRPPPGWRDPAPRREPPKPPAHEPPKPPVAHEPPQHEPPKPPAHEPPKLPDHPLADASSKLNKLGEPPMSDFAKEEDKAIARRSDAQWRARSSNPPRRA